MKSAERFANWLLSLGGPDRLHRTLMLGGGLLALTFILPRGVYLPGGPFNAWEAFLLGPSWAIETVYALITGVLLIFFGIIRPSKRVVAIWLAAVVVIPLLHTWYIWSDDEPTATSIVHLLRELVWRISVVISVLLLARRSTAEESVVRLILVAAAIVFLVCLLLPLEAGHSSELELGLLRPYRLLVRGGTGYYWLPIELSRWLILLLGAQVLSGRSPSRGAAFLLVFGAAASVVAKFANSLEHFGEFGVFLVLEYLARSLQDGVHWILWIVCLAHWADASARRTEGPRLVSPSAEAEVATNPAPRIQD